ETVDVLLNGDQNLSGHVAAFLGSRGLIFHVNSGSALLHEHLSELHDCCQSTVASVCISDQRSEIVDGSRSTGEFGIGHVGPRLALLPVVEQLGHEEVLDLVGDRVRWVIWRT
ncbi:unnamed protein product, partial [Mycena citricolor]